MKRTPLYEQHLALNARMVDFAGWEMPLQYTGIKEETAFVREQQGVFDVSHMGEFFVTGEGAGEFLDYLLSRKISHKDPAITNYALLCMEDGGVVDDLMVYHLGEEFYMLVVNAANIEKDFSHIEQVLKTYQVSNAVQLANVSDDYGLLAVQGKGSMEPIEAALTKLYPNLEFVEELKKLKRFRQMNLPIEEKFLIISRTGYTGEDGYEIYLPATHVVQLWQNLLKLSIKPCGLGARDALRLEAGLPLYGHELSEKINPLEAGLEKFVDLEREFIGKNMVNHVQNRLIAIKAEDKSIPRDQYKVFYQDKEIGKITSGSFSPTLNKGIAFALVSQSLPDTVSEVQVEIRRKRVNFKITKTPFI